MALAWVKATGGNWHSLDYLDLSRVHGHGVYVIWKPGSSLIRPAVSVVVRVGEGDIGARLAVHRMDPAIMRHGPGLLVTWAEVGGLFSGGVEVYLSQQLRPIVGQRYPLSIAVEVNLPVQA